MKFVAINTTEHKEDLMHQPCFALILYTH